MRSITLSSLGRVFPNSEHHGSLLPFRDHKGNTLLSALSRSLQRLAVRCVEMAACREPRSKGGGYRSESPQNTCRTSARCLRNPTLLPIIACSEPLFLLTMSETSCGMLCAGHDII